MSQNNSKPKAPTKPKASCSSTPSGDKSAHKTWNFDNGDDSICASGWSTPKIDAVRKERLIEGDALQIALVPPISKEELTSIIETFTGTAFAHETANLSRLSGENQLMVAQGVA